MYHIYNIYVGIVNLQIDTGLTASVSKNFSHVSDIKLKRIVGSKLCFGRWTKLRLLAQVAKDFTKDFFICML